MTSVDQILDSPRPPSAEAARASWPTRHQYNPSPGDWRDEVLYFLLPDRFSDTRSDRPSLGQPTDISKLWELRGGRQAWKWAAWSGSGLRFQGGTIAGVTSRLDYLKELGVTALWVGPVWKQRRETDDYHGYAIQDFLDVDPRFGTRRQLVELVRCAHEIGIKIILDIVINHTGENWFYKLPNGTLTSQPPYTGTRYEFGQWLDGDGHLCPPEFQLGKNDGVWPSELQDPEAYHRMGFHTYEGEWTDDANAVFRTADWCNRDLALIGPGNVGNRTLETLVTCWTYWIALTDCDGFRIDTLKHVSEEEGRQFCGAVREFAESIGKHNFLLAGEAGGGDFVEEKVLRRLGANLTAALEIGENRNQLVHLGEGEPNSGAAPGVDGAAFFNEYRRPDRFPATPSHRSTGANFVTSLGDHDNLWLNLQRFSVDAPGPLQAVVGSALLLFTLGIPCLYYGTEQGLAAPESGERQWLTGWHDSNGHGDRYLREAMFGPDHPRHSGGAGVPTFPQKPDDPDLYDDNLVGFGPFGTAGYQVFDVGSPIFRRIKHLLEARKACTALRAGRQYQREVSLRDRPNPPPVASLLAWSRILAGQECLVVVNPDGAVTQSGEVRVDALLSPPGSRVTVVANTASCDRKSAAPGLTAPLTVGSGARMQAFVRIETLYPGEVMVVVNKLS